MYPEMKTVSYYFNRDEPKDLDAEALQAATAAWITARTAHEILIDELAQHTGREPQLTQVVKPASYGRWVDDWRQWEARRTELTQDLDTAAAAADTCRAAVEKALPLPFVWFVVPVGDEQYTVGKGCPAKYSGYLRAVVVVYGDELPDLKAGLDE